MVKRLTLIKIETYFKYLAKLGMSKAKLKEKGV